MQPGTKTHVQSQEGVRNLPAGPQVVFCFSRFMRLRLVQILATVLCGSRQPQCSCKSWLKQFTLVTFGDGLSPCAHPSGKAHAGRSKSSPHQGWLCIFKSKVAIKTARTYRCTIIYRYIWLCYIHRYSMKLAIGWTHRCKNFSHTPKGKKLTSETHVVCLCQSHVMICDDIQLSGKEDSVSKRNLGRPTKQSFLTGTCIGGCSSCRCSFSKVGWVEQFDGRDPGGSIRCLCYAVMHHMLICLHKLKRQTNKVVPKMACDIVTRLQKPTLRFSLCQVVNVAAGRFKGTVSLQAKPMSSNSYTLAAEATRDCIWELSV